MRYFLPIVLAVSLVSAWPADFYDDEYCKVGNKYGHYDYIKPDVCFGTYEASSYKGSLDPHYRQS